MWCEGGAHPARPCEAVIGKFCGEGCEISSGHSCPVGFYCEGGQEPKKACTAAVGFYCAVESSTAAGETCPPGFHCPGLSADKIECAEGTLAGYYCPAQTATPEGSLCPVGHSCAGGPAPPVPCTAPPGTYCPAGTALGAEPTECAAGYYCVGEAEDQRPCTVPEGFYCPPGAAEGAAGTPCPVDPLLGMFCCAGGSADKELCPPPPDILFLAETPPPVMCNWWVHKTQSAGVQPDPIFSSISRQADVQEGVLEGVFNLPVKGVWLLRFGFFVPAYNRQAYLNAIFPGESVETVAEGDSIEVNINGVTKTLTSTPDLQGHKEFVELTAEGMQIRYSFHFKSSKVPKILHPFVSPGEVTLLRDSNEAPAGAGTMGTMVASAVDAVDGKTLNVGRSVSNGYIASEWVIQQDPKVLIFQGSTLVRETTFLNGKLDETLPVGQYSCIGILRRFYTFFIRNCNVVAGTNYLGPFPFSPVLNPGNTRIVLEWGATPSDLDSYLTVPPPPSNPGHPCLLMYRNKKCDEGTLSQVTLDLDALAHSRRGGLPETVTFGLITPGKYTFWVSEYRGRDENGLLGSGASVSFYSEGFQRRFMVGRDGYVEGINWYVFYIQGDTKELFMCDRATCPPV